MWKSVKLAVLGIAMVAAVPSVKGQEAAAKARQFLNVEARGRFVTNYVHFGAQYRGHTFQSIRTVNNRPGHFALVYRLQWADDGLTDVAFLCDPRGNVYEVQWMATNAGFQVPFLLANASIQVLGNLLLDAFRDQLTAQEFQQARQFIEQADARSLLQLGLRLQQSFGQ